MTAFVSIPQHTLGPGEKCARLATDEGCYWCCSACNYDTHQCPGCGTPLSHLGNELILQTPGERYYEPHEGCTD